MSVDDIKDWAWLINVVGAVLLVIAVQYLRGIFAAKDRVEGIVAGPPFGGGAR